MSSSKPFIDQGTGQIETAALLTEVIPLAKLIGVFVAVALVPFGLVFLTLGNTIVGALLAVVAQFVLAVGAGIVLMYVIARGIQLSETQ